MPENKSNLKPPDHVLGQTILNKSLFEKTITVPSLKVKDIKISSVLPIVKKYLLKLENFKPVNNVSSDEAIIYLNPDIISNWIDFTLEEQSSLKQLSFNESSLEIVEKTIGYDNFNVETILRSVLPKDVEGTSSFTKVGHIVHVNLREHLLPYKDIIGQVLFEKIPGCKTVVNKVDSIDNTYRNFKMEILRGEDCMKTQVKENKCIFEFDFSKVYWNSRLCTEHERIVKMVDSGSVFFDVFSGVGPFSIPLAKKKCQVFANDLNPESYDWLEHNCNINKVDRNYFKSYNKDGKDFILEEIKTLLPKFIKEKKKIYICMNLPALAVEFLQFFVNLYKAEEFKEIETSPTVIVYCFAKGEDCVNIAKNVLFKNIGFEINEKIIDIFRVRTVSSLKEMMRITFKLDEDILTGSILKHKRKLNDDESNIVPKKCKNGEEQTKKE